MISFTLYYFKGLMTSIVKNVLTLIFFIIFVAFLGRAEASERHDIFWSMLGDSAFINWTSVERCCLRYDDCEVV
jgi:hypothetical protein